MIHLRIPKEDEEGQGLVEYALILVFVAVVIILLLTILGPGIRNVYQNIINAMQEASN
jgi:pilus assembly protein Flp/PilA